MGVSGLGRVVPFRRDNLAGIDERKLRFAQGFDGEFGITERAS